MEFWRNWEEHEKQVMCISLEDGWRHVVGKFRRAASKEIIVYKDARIQQYL